MTSETSVWDCATAHEPLHSLLLSEKNLNSQITAYQGICHSPAMIHPFLLEQQGLGMCKYVNMSMLGWEINVATES